MDGLDSKANSEQQASKRSKRRSQEYPSSGRGYAVMVLGVSEKGDFDENEPVYAAGLHSEQVQHIALQSAQYPPSQEEGRVRNEKQAFIVTSSGLLKQWGPWGWDSIKHNDREIHLYSFFNEEDDEEVKEDRGYLGFGERIVKLSCGFDHLAFVNVDGALYTMGKGQYGKLGNGKEEPYAIICPLHVKFPHGIPIQQVACGKEFTVALTRDSGQVWSWGSNEFGCTGLGTSDGFQLTPKHVTGPWTDAHQGGSQQESMVVQVISAFYQSCGAVTSDGLVYTWGSNRHSNLGTGSDEECRVAPTLVRGELMRPREEGGGGYRRAARYISCGLNHMLALTEEGRVYAWGNNTEGQLGVGDTNDRSEPVKITKLQGLIVKDVACGAKHSAAVTNRGEMFTWGINNNRQLGLRTKMSRILEPQKIESFSSMSVCKIICADFYTLALVDPDTLPPNDWVPIQKSFKSMLDDDCPFKDVSFKTQDGVVVCAHRAILSQRCPFFNKMFLSGLQESQNMSAVVPIPNMTASIFRQVLTYLYTDKIIIRISDALDLYQAADLYGLDNLRLLVLQAVRSRLTIPNVCSFLRGAASSNCEQLQEICISFMVENFKEVSSRPDLATVPAELLSEVMSRFGKTL